MLIEDDGFVVLDGASFDDDVAGDDTQPITDDELFSGRIDPARGLFVATCGDLFTGAERSIGAAVAGRSLRQGLCRSGAIRRWYVIRSASEPVELDRQPALIRREHLVPMPMFWRIPADEAAAIAREGLVHALVSTGFDNPRNLLWRAVTQTPVPNMAFVHSIPEQSASLLHLLAGQTFPFDVLVSPSECGKRVLEAHFERITAALGVTPFAGRIAVIPHGVDTSGAWPERAEARARLGWAADAEIVLGLGRFDAEYKADLAPLIVAFRALAQRRPRARLVLGGADLSVYALRLDALTAELGLGDRVELRPNISEATKHDLLAGADLFVAIADNVQETHGLAILEAMAASLPVVATAWNGFRETVVHDQTGLLVPTAWHAPNADMAATSTMDVGTSRPLALQPQHVRFDIGAMSDALERLLAAPEQRRRFGDAGRARAIASFDAETNGRRAAELLVEATRAATAGPIAWRPHLGADWMAVFGHYAGTNTPPSVPRAFATETTLGEQRFATIDRALRKRVRHLLERAATEAKGQPFATLVDTLALEFPAFSRQAVERFLIRAAKHGWLRVE